MRSSPYAKHWLFVIASLDPRHGGPSRGILTLTRELCRQGDEVVLLSLVERGQPPHPELEGARRAGVKIVTVSRRRLTRFRFSLRFTLLAFMHARKADVVSNHGFYQWPTVVAYAAASHFRRPLFVQPHGVFEPYQEARGSRWKPRFMRLIGERVLRYSTFMPVATQGEACGVIRSLPGVPVVPRVLGMGVYRVTDEGPDDLERFSSRRVIFISRIAHKKRLDKLLDAAELARSAGQSFELTVAGDGDNELVNALKQRSARIPGVEWVGHVDGEARRSLERASTVMCLPSDNENFGQVVTEAMAAGLPVITTDAVGASLHVKAASSGWVLADPTAAELELCLRHALGDPERLLQMSKSGQAYVRQNLSWERVAEDWRALAREATAKK